VTESSVIRQVIRYLGIIALVLAAGSIYVLVRILDASAGRDTVDPAVVGLFASLTTLTGAAVGGLASMLVSTRSGQAEPSPVVVTNAPDDAVPVDPT
jgi:hypothetical protein